MKRHIITIILTLAAMSASAQGLVFGRVQDAFLKTPITEAKVSLLLAADSTVVIDSIPITVKRRDDGTVREAQFMLQPEKKNCKYLLRGRLEGYEDGYLPLTIDASNTGAIMLDDALEPRKIRQVNLQEVTVTATKVKMYYRGDTIVYDATAFKLPDGSMLDDLIHQMPGVTIDEYGQIFVNGRKIDELQLGSRSFMRGNSKVLMENLPYYTVKDIKVYDQDTDLNRALNAQVEKKKFVMDVNLKPEHQIGYIANVEAAGGTMERWLGRAFLLGFTERTRYTLLGNSNNVNESRHIGRSDHWTPDAVPQSLLTTHSAAGEIDYQGRQECARELDRRLHFHPRRGGNDYEQGTVPTGQPATKHPPELAVESPKAEGRQPLQVRQAQRLSVQLRHCVQLQVIQRQLFDTDGAVHGQPDNTTAHRWFQRRQGMERKRLRPYTADIKGHREDSPVLPFHYVS